MLPMRFSYVFVAYLLQARSSTRKYDTWICGGAIVNKWLMLTSAACVEDVQNMYAVAGTEMYIKSRKLDDHPCTQTWKRKVIYTCVPFEYDLQYDKVSKWSYVDIAVVKVEKPFLSEKQDWKDCSYSPTVIPVNFNSKYEVPGTDAIVLGWGHSTKWRLKQITADFNKKKLQYVSVSILDQEECKKSYQTPDMGKQIDDFMICTYHDGNIDEGGKPIRSRKSLSNGIKRKEIIHKKQDSRKQARPNSGSELSYNEESKTHWNHSYRNTSESVFNYTRRKGICQNDHGGPLVTWINGTEHVIGIASVFRVDQKSSCMGPYLYTSTAKNKEFIDCILKDLIQTDDDRRRRSVCDQSSNGGLLILRRYITWTNDHIHRVVPKLNVHMRPQIPMNQYFRGK